MSRLARRGLIIVGVVVVLLVLVALAARMAAQPVQGTVLEVTLRDEIPETSAPGPIGSILGVHKLTLRDYIEAILRARDDRRIPGLLVTIDRSSLGLAQIQDLRDAIADFQAAGKWATCFLETAGEFSPGNREYYLATACGSIWLVPSGDVNLTGVRLETPFIRGSLDKLGVFPDFDHIGAYKSFMNFFTERKMTPAHREMMESLAESVYRQIRRGIAQGRHLPEDKVAALIDGGPYLGPRALQDKLVDTLGYRDELEKALKEKNGGRLPFMKVDGYLRTGRYYDHGVRVALIYGMGSVARGESDYDPVLTGSVMGSETVAGAIRAAREDRSIKAIVMRVDSPGGSYVASDIIWREVDRTRGVKPIVVSMSDLAGSGGYFVSMDADRIVAQPATLTASIGVLSGKFVTPGFWDKLGVSHDAVQRGRHATFYSSEVRFSPEERTIFEAWLKRIYDDFVGKAAKGRGKSPKEIDAIGQGRVWTGEDALRLGLVDVLGGLPVAVREALTLAKLDPKSPVRLVLFPPPRPLYQQILGRGDDTRAAFAALAERAARLVREGSVLQGEEVLMMPPVTGSR